MIKKYPLNKLKIIMIEITIQFFICFPSLKTKCALQRRLQPFEFIQAVSFLQLPRGNLRSAGKHGCGRARQRGVNEPDRLVHRDLVNERQTDDKPADPLSYRKTPRDPRSVVRLQ